MCTASILFTISCKKEVYTPLSNYNDRVFIRLAEVGSGKVISNAKYRAKTNVCTNYDFEFGCTQWEEETVYSNTKGELIVNRVNFKNYRIEKDGYWSNTDPSHIYDVLFNPYYNNNPAPTINLPGIPGSPDTTLIKLFPVSIINIKIKNTGSSNGGYFDCNTFFNGQTAYGEPIMLHPGIDTNFQYRVFGNATNKMFIVRGYVPGSAAGDTISIQEKNIGKDEALSLEFLY